MGIINVTPDSFFDGGRFHSQDKAVERGFALIEQGTAILDVGGESTRPYANEVPTEEEIERVIPVIKELAPHGFVSVDTRKAKVMEKALEAGAKMVNDVSGLAHDPDSLKVVRDASCQVVIMHSQGEPKNMQDNPTYSDLKQEIFGYLLERKKQCMEAGIQEENMYLDPGMGFGKLKEHNFWILKNLNLLSKDAPVLLGASRKSFLSEKGDSSGDRLPQSLAVAAAAKEKGVKILRVHDVEATRRFLDTLEIVKNTSNQGEP